MPSTFKANIRLGNPDRQIELISPCAVLVASAFCILLSFKVLGPARGFISVWPLNAVETAFCLNRRRTTRSVALMQLFAVSGIVAGGIACHLGLPMISVIVLLSQLEVAVAYRLLRGKVSGFDDLRQAPGMIRFGWVSLACPAVTAAIAALPLAIIMHHSVWAIATASAMADALGYVTMLPPLLLLFSGLPEQLRVLKPRFSIAIPAVVLFLAATIFAFWQTSDPVLFIIFPPLIFVVFALGLEGAVCATASIALIGSIATKLDHGPLTLAQTAAKSHMLFLLQAFVWIAGATALPVGSLLGEQRRARRRATEAELVYKTLLQNTDDTIIMSSLDGSHRYISPSVTRLTGWTPEEFLAMDRFSTIHPDDRALGRSVVESILAGQQQHSFRYRLACKNGSFHWVEATVRGYKDESGSAPVGYVATVRDVSERRQQEHAWDRERVELALTNRELALAANTDKLTGLQNRRGLDEAFADAGSCSTACLLLMDVDHFKAYNDRYGHPAGDECLRKLANVLRESTAKLQDCTVARFGGEEFAILLPGTSQKQAFDLAVTVLAKLAVRFIEHKDSPRGFVTMSIGIAGWTDNPSVHVAEVIKLADLALYQSKRAGRNRVTCSDKQPTKVAEYERELMSA